MSLVVVETIELRTNDATKVVRLSRVEKVHSVGGYGCELEVVSGGFSCKRPFYFDDAGLSVAVESIGKMATGTPGAAVI